MAWSNPNTERKQTGSGGKKRSPGSNAGTLSSVPAEMNLGMLELNCNSMCPGISKTRRACRKICRLQKEGWGECGPTVEWGREPGETGHGKSLILLSFLTSLFISWTGLLGILGARDRRETLVQGRCALGDRGVDQGMPKQTRS